MKEIIGADAAKLAGLQIDQLQKIRKGQITIDHLEWFNKLSKKERDKLSGRIEVFSIWKTIKLGTGLENAEDFREALSDGELHLGDWASDILGRPAFSVATEETEVDLVKVTVAELGFDEGTNLKQIYKRAQELGLDLCPAEVGPQLRLQYQNQSNGEWILIGMEPITASDGGPLVFGVGRAGSGSWLDSYWSYPDDVWDPDGPWVFVRSRK